MSLKDILQRHQRGELLLPLLKKHLSHEQELLDRKQLHKRDIAVQDAELTIESFRERKAEYEQPDPVGQFFHPSSLGHCMRQQWYYAMKASQDGTRTAEDLIRKHMILEMGTYTHVMFQNLCTKAGFLTERECAILDPERKILGHGDGKLKLPRKVLPPDLWHKTRGKFLLEIKTINPRFFGKLTGPQFDHKQQATAYMKCLGLRAVIFVYIDTDRRLMKEFLFEFDQEFYMEYVHRRIRRYFRHVERRTQPDREGAGSPKAPPCCWCPFTVLCYTTDENKKFVRKLQKEQKAKLKA